jgi:hypothetical protein
VAAVASPRRSHDEYVAAAQRVLAEHGPAFTTPLSMADAARGLGTSRAALYQWWSTGSDLDAAVTEHLASAQENWAATLVAHPPAAGLAQGLRFALRDRNAAAGVAERTAVAAWPAASPVRARVAAAELQRIHQLANWLRAADDGRSDAPWLDVAFGVLAYVEGRLFLDGIHGSDPNAPMTTEQIETTSTIASNMLHELLAAASGAAAPIEIPAPPTDPIPPGRLRILDEIAGWHRAERPAAATARLVDITVLATELDVSKRRLQTLWPSATDLNADLMTRSIGSLRARVEDLTFQTFTAAMGGYDKFLGLFESTYQAILAGSSTDARLWFGCAPALSDDALRHRADQLLTEWQDAQHLALFAALQVIGHRIRPTVDGTQYVGSVFACVNGALRLSLLHPAVLERTVSYAGRTCGALPAAIDAMFRSFTEAASPAQPGTDRETSEHWAPPIPETP